MIQLPEGSWWDWDVVERNAGRLTLGASSDLSYHHDLEPVFSDPLLVSCPAAFQDPIFREPTPEEMRAVSRQTGETPEVVVAFEADAGGPDPASGLIASGGLEIVRGTVLRYWPGDPAPGERLAPWVRPPGAQ